MTTKHKLLIFKKKNVASVLPIPINAWAWFDASDSLTLFQDTAGTNPVTADAQTVALWKDKSGNSRDVSQSSSGVRPIYKVTQQNNLPGLYFDATRVLDTSVNFTSTGTILVVGTRLTTVSVTMGLITSRDSVSGGWRVSWNSSNQVLSTTDRKSVV